MNTAAKEQHTSIVVYKQKYLYGTDNRQQIPDNINLFQLCLQTVRGGRSEGGEGNTSVKGVALKTGVLTFFNV